MPLGGQCRRSKPTGDSSRQPCSGADVLAGVTMIGTWHAIFGAGLGIVATAARYEIMCRHVAVTARRDGYE